MDVKNGSFGTKKPEKPDVSNTITEDWKG